MKETRASNRLRSEGDSQGLYSSENRKQPCFPATCASSFLRAVTRDSLSLETVCNVRAPTSLPIFPCSFSLAGRGFLSRLPPYSLPEPITRCLLPSNAQHAWLQKRNEVTEVNTLSFFLLVFPKDMYRCDVFYGRYFVAHRTRLLGNWTRDTCRFPCGSVCTKIKLARHLSVLEL